MVPTNPEIYLLFCALSVIIYSALGSDQILKPGSDEYNIWKKNTVPRIVKIFVFNWTNPEDIENKTIKPRFEEVGPYTFREITEKTNIIWNNNGTVTYKELRTWWFEPEKSNGTLDDVVTTLNIIPLQISEAVKNEATFLKLAMSMVFDRLDTKLSVSVSVGQLLFDGYEDPILEMINQMFTADSFNFSNKFAYFYGVNGTDTLNGIFNINTGVNGQLGELKQWNFQNDTKHFPDSCDNFDSSSAGDYFPNNMTKTNVIKIFTNNICRNLELEFEKEVNFHGKVVYKYAAADRFLDNGTKIPENKCFCDGDCIPYGVLNVTSCNGGAPVFISLPHFYKTDPFFLEALDGIETSPETDDVYMIFDPVTGIPLESSLGLQFNLHMHPIQQFRLLEHLPDVYLPIFYIQEFLSKG